MRKLSFFLLVNLILMPAILSAQDNINTWLSSDSVRVGNLLVEYAWQNYPLNESVQYEVKIAKEDKFQTKWDWLNRITASFNLNEGNINPTIQQQNLFFPRYNFGVSVGMGIFLQTPSKIKAAGYNVEIAENAVEEQKLMIRREVLTTYHNYLMGLRMLQLKTKAYEDINSSHISTESAFLNGEIDITEYNNSLVAKNGALESRIVSEYQLATIRFQLEQMLGDPLEVVKSKLGK